MRGQQAKRMGVQGRWDGTVDPRLGFPVTDV
jgi:hypothetical protein